MRYIWIYEKLYIIAKINFFKWFYHTIVFSAWQMFGKPFISKVIKLSDAKISLGKIFYIILADNKVDKAALVLAIDRVRLNFVATVF